MVSDLVHDGSAPRLRSLHLINTLGPGGAERSLAEVLPALGPHGFAPVVAVFGRAPVGVHDEVIDRAIPVIDLGARTWAERVWAVRSLVQDLQPHVIHTSIFEADLVGRCVGAMSRTPVVTSVVNTSYGAARTADPNVSARKLALARRLDAITARALGSGFHAISGAVADDASRVLGLDRASITVIPRARSAERLGVASPERRARARARFGIGPEELLVVNLARREFQKGQDVLVGAAAELVRRGRPVQVRIAGRDGSRSALLEQQIDETGLRGQVRCLGHLDDAPELLAAADVFAFPSRFEGLGGALLEALALEVPVVASDVPALREVLRDGEAGTLVPADDPVALAEAITAVQDDPDGARRRARAGAEIVRRSYRLDEVVAATAAWLRAHAAVGPARPALPQLAVPASVSPSS